jgi:hypothetical protein
MIYLIIEFFFILTVARKRTPQIEAGSCAGGCAEALSI